MSLANRPRGSNMSPHARTFGILSAGLVAIVTALWWFDPHQCRIPLCSFYASTGLYCPGCGGTRAAHELLHGHWSRAMHENGLAVLGLPLLAYLLASEFSLSFYGRPLWGNLSRRTGLVVSLAIVALAFAVLRNLPWYPWTLLAPPGP